MTPSQSSARSRSKTMRRPAVWVVDDDPDLCHALDVLLREARFDVRAYTDPSAFLREFEQSCPACILLDLRMPQMDGFAVHDELKGRGVTTPVVFLTGHGDVPLAVRAMRGGATNFLEKPTRTPKLLEEIRNAITYDKSRRRIRRERVRSSSVPGPRAPDSLSRRELEVARLLCAGLRNRQIGQTLNLSVRTVEMHRARMLRRLGVTTVPEACRILAAAGVVPDA